MNLNPGDKNFIGFLALIIISFILLISYSGKATQQEEFEPKAQMPYLYLEIETINRTYFKRTPDGIIDMRINPREDEEVHIGGHIIKSPKSVRGTFIQFGDFILNKLQGDAEFIHKIEAFNPILYKVMNDYDIPHEEDE